MSLNLSPDRAALLVVDMQNGFCHPEGGLAQSGQDNLPQQSIVPIVKTLVCLARKVGFRVAWSKQIHFPDHRGREGRQLPSHLRKKPKAGTPICERGSWDVDFVEELQAVVDSDDEIIVKHKMSCFYQTRLEEVLRLWGVSTLIVVGVSTYVCVESTIRDAYYRDFDIIVVEDCVAGSDEPLHRATLEKTRRYFGEVLSIKELEKSLAEQLREKTLE